MTGFLERGAQVLGAGARSAPFWYATPFLGTVPPLILAGVRVALLAPGCAEEGTGSIDHRARKHMIPAQVAGRDFIGYGVKPAVIYIPIDKEIHIHSTDYWL